VASGAAVFLAPTGIVGSIVAGTVWGVGRWGWRRNWRKKRVQQNGNVEGRVRELDAGREVVEAPW
jgi:hypothetical protein